MKICLENEKFVAYFVILTSLVHLSNVHFGWHKDKYYSLFENVFCYYSSILRSEIHPWWIEKICHCQTTLHKNWTLFGTNYKTEFNRFQMKKRSTRMPRRTPIPTRSSLTKMSFLVRSFWKMIRSPTFSSLSNQTLAKFPVLSISRPAMTTRSKSTGEKIICLRWCLFTG